MQIAVRGIEAPEARDGGKVVVFIELWIEISRSIAGPIAGKDYPPIGAVTGRDIVVIRRLAGDFCDRVRAIGQAGDFIQLPEEQIGIGGVTRRACHHAEQGPGTVPVDRRITDGDAIGVLNPREPKTESAREIG